jgi:hypothetical protein
MASGAGRMREVRRGYDFCQDQAFSLSLVSRSLLFQRHTAPEPCPGLKRV